MSCCAPHIHATRRVRKPRRTRAAKIDPTQTTMLRRRFEAEVDRRFGRIKAMITEAVVEQDGFGLHTNKARFDFPRTQQKVGAFMRWLKEAEKRHILTVTKGTSLTPGKAWTSTYIQASYKKGVEMSARQMRRWAAEVSSQWVEGALNRPIHADRIAQIFTRTYDSLENITKVMDQQISRVLAQGLVEGKNPRDIARTLHGRVNRIGITRARVMARTEVIAAHAEATLNSYTEAGAEGVEVEAEWDTAGYDVCPICEDLEGNTYTIEEARSLLPAHPNCRCTWLPKLGDMRGVVLG